MSESTQTIRRVLIDTNIVSAHFKGELQVASNLESCEAVFLPVVVLGELLFGARRSANVARNLDRVERFASATILLSTDSETARNYGQIKADLTATGLIIPDNDLWIVSLSIQHQLPIVSRDQHFSHIPRLQWLVW